MASIASKQVNNQVVSLNADKRRHSNDSTMHYVLSLLWRNRQLGRHQLYSLKAKNLDLICAVPA